ncbi:MAG: exo-alpha-sialidase [Silicimonas sp.]|nr:exo-alpha-sialidase [Silicimonas sp.]
MASGDNWFVNWADFPSVSPIDKTRWAAHWLAKRPGGTYAYDVAVALSDDAGSSWSAPIVPHTDGTPTEHGFVSLFPWDDDVGVLWLDGRQMTADHASGHGGEGGMTLRSARLGARGQISDARRVDDLVCDCCQTDVAIAGDGPVAVYRNRTPEEIRDIYLARTVDGHWQPGTPVADDGWEINGCPVNGPAVVAQDNDVAVAWFTAANDQPRVRAAFSDDGGATFAAAVDIDSERPTGRVDIEMLDKTTAVVSWIAGGTQGHDQIALRVIGRDGAMGPKRQVAPIATSRASGFPQMIRLGEELVFAWTDTTGETSQVRTATVSIQAIR